MDNEAPPPEGELITTALKRIRPKLSVREAARRAGISEGWWRQVVRGYQPLKGGGRAPMTGSAETVAAMAQVVGVTPEQLEAASRTDAAEELRAMAAHSGDVMNRAEAMMDENERLIAEILALPPREQQTAKAAVKAVIDALKKSAETPGADGETRR